MKSKVIVVVIVLAIGSGGLWFLRQNNGATLESDSKQTSSDVNVVAEGKSAYISFGNVEEGNVDLGRPGILSFEGGSPENEQLMIEWNRSHGYDGLNTTHHTYGPLDNKSLEALRDAGDVMAATMLARRLGISIDSEDRIQSIQAHRDAASLGSTLSMVALGTGTKIGFGPSPEIDARAEEGAWYLLAMEGGDPAGHLNFGWMIDKYDGNVDDLVWRICKRRDALHEELGKNRLKFNAPKPQLVQFPGLRIAIENGDVLPLPTCN